MKRIFFNEVSTRDGFQIEPSFIPTDTKVALIDALSECGYAKIEATSFASPKAIPMLRDADEVMGRIQRLPGVEYTVLMPNLRGAERALEARADELSLVMSTSETHNLANLRMPMAHSFAALSSVIRHGDVKTPSMCLYSAVLAARWKVMYRWPMCWTGSAVLPTWVCVASRFLTRQAWRIRAGQPFG